MYYTDYYKYMYVCAMCYMYVPVPSLRIERLAVERLCNESLWCRACVEGNRVSSSVETDALRDMTLRCCNFLLS